MTDEQRTAMARRDAGDLNDPAYEVGLERIDRVTKRRERIEQLDEDPDQRVMHGWDHVGVLCNNMLAQALVERLDRVTKELGLRPPTVQLPCHIARLALWDRLEPLQESSLQPSALRLVETTTTHTPFLNGREVAAQIVDVAHVAATLSRRVAQAQAIGPPQRSTRSTTPGVRQPACALTGPHGCSPDSV